MYWLDRFYKIMPHVDILCVYAQMQNTQSDQIKLNKNLADFYPETFLIQANIQSNEITE